MNDVKTSSAPAASKRRQLAIRIGAVLVRLALDAVVIDAAYETWNSPSPIRIGVVAATAVYFLLSLWVLSKGGRIGGRGWLTDPLAPLFLLLLFLVAATWTLGGVSLGVTVLRQPTPVVLAGATLALALLATWRLAGPPGFKAWWTKLPLAAVGIYGGWAFVLAIRQRTPYLALLGGAGFWDGFPIGLRGAPLAAFGLLPLAFVRECALSLSRLTLRGLVRWILLFGVGCWIVFNASAL
ncbi:MAG TPA: hypothetical protein VGK32_02340 [Vicinamibacterales bacterium]|jgi:hypothetical protein